MSAEIHGLVQTSLNLGILATEETSLRASFCVRSSVDSQREMLKDRLTCLMDYGNITAKKEGSCTVTVTSVDNPEIKAEFKSKPELYPKVMAVGTVFLTKTCKDALPDLILPEICHAVTF